jgi:hypothetical protein
MVSRRLGLLTRAALLLVASGASVACSSSPVSESPAETASALREGVQGIVCSHFRRYGSPDQPQFDDAEQCAPFGSDLAPLYDFAKEQSIAQGRLRWQFAIATPVLSFDVRTEPWWTFDDDASVTQFVAEQDRLINFLAAKTTVGPPDLNADTIDRSGAVALQALYDALATGVERLERQSRSVRRQRRAVANNVDDGLAALRAHLLGRAVDPSRRDAVLARASAETIRRQLDALLPSALALPPTLQSSVVAFTTLRDQTPASNDKIRALVEKGSSAALTEIAAVEQSVRDWSAREISLCDSVSREARAASVEARTLASDVHSAAASFGAVRAQGIDVPPLSENVAGATDAMATWAELRKADVRALAQDIVSGLFERKEALLQAATDDATRDTFVKTRLLKASQLFTEEQTRRSEELLRLPPRTMRLKAPLLAEKLDAAIAYAQLRTTCDGSPLDAVAWRFAGCQILVRNANEHRAALASTERGNAPPRRRRGGAGAGTGALARGGFDHPSCRRERRAAP